MAIRRALERAAWLLAEAVRWAVLVVLAGGCVAMVLHLPVAYALR